MAKVRREIGETNGVRKRAKKKKKKLNQTTDHRCKGLQGGEKSLNSEKEEGQVERGRDQGDRHKLEEGQ